MIEMVAVILGGFCVVIFVAHAVDAYLAPQAGSGTAPAQHFNRRYLEPSSNGQIGSSPSAETSFRTLSKPARHQAEYPVGRQSIPPCNLGI